MPNHKLFKVDIEKYQEKKRYVKRIQSMLLKLQKQSTWYPLEKTLIRFYYLTNPRYFDESNLPSPYYHPVHKTRCSVASKHACLINLIHRLFKEWWSYLQDKDCRFLDYYLNFLEYTIEEGCENFTVAGDVAKGYRLKVRK